MLVVQNDAGNQAGATTVVVSLTSVVPSEMFPFQVQLPAGVLGKPGVIHCEQIKTVSIDRVEPGGGGGVLRPTSCAGGRALCGCPWGCRFAPGGMNEPRARSDRQIGQRRP